MRHHCYRVCLLSIMLLVGCTTAPPPAPHTQLPSLPMDSHSDKRVAFAQAVAWMHAGRTEHALSVFSTLRSVYPALVDYHLFYTGQLHVQRGADTEAAAAFRELLTSYPESVHVAAAAVALGTLQQQHDPAAAHQLFTQGHTAADPGTRHLAQFGLAQLAERAGDVTAAAHAYAALRRDAAGTAIATHAKTRLLALRTAHPDLVPRGAARQDELRTLIAEDANKDALQLATRILADPHGVDVVKVRRQYADLLYSQGQLEEALTALWDISVDYPRHSAAPAALYRMASLLWNRDRDAAAQRTFQKFRARFPRDRRADDALYAIARIHQSAGRYTQALHTYTQVQQHYPKGDHTTAAQWQTGWMQYTRGHFSAAAEAFRQLARRTRTDQRAAALYWQARALDRAGRRTQARAIYQRIATDMPLDFYAMWAQQRLDDGVLTLPHVTAQEFYPSHQVATTLGTLPAPPLAAGFHVQRFVELRAIGLDALAREELAAIARTQEDTAAQRYVLRAYPAVNGFAPAFRLLRRLGGRAGLSGAERRQLYYPLAFWDIVYAEATIREIDPLLIMALIRQESFFDPAAHSPANAHGLMQLIPSTARRMAAELGIPEESLDLTDPALNVRLGTYYLRSLVDRFHGNVLKALAAYNGGEAAVEKWERRAPGAEPDEFVEHISYRETRKYVKKVLTHYRKYQRYYR